MALNVGFTLEIKTDVKDLHKLFMILAEAEKTAIPAAVKASTKNIERESKKLIRTGKRSGIKYSGMPNRSSAPGEPPKTQSGRLANSIKSIYGHNSKSGTATGMVVAIAPHALWLEQGAVRVGSNSLLEPRPFFKPVLDREMPLLIANIVDRLK